jgi:hypothetical protein
MNKKNMLGMDMLEWKHLSGLADPYKLALAQAGAMAGVPAVAGQELTESDTEFNLKDFEKHYQEPSDDDDKSKEVVKVPRALQGRGANERHAVRLGAVAAVAKSREERLKKAKDSIEAHRKSFGGAKPAKISDYSEKQQARILRKAAERKESANEDVTYGDVWCAYLEDRGSSAEEFDYLVNLAIENGDEEMAGELLAMEDQLDEILGGMGKAVGWVAGKAVQGASNLAQGVKAGFNSAKAPVPGAAPPAGGGAPAGATPPVGAPPQVPAGATPPPAPNGGATPPPVPGAPATPPVPGPGTQAAATISPGAPPKKPGLLGRAIGAVAKGIGGAVGAAKAGYAAGKAQPQVASVDAEDFELFLGEEHGLSAEQYIEICEHAFATNDVEMIECINAMEEGVFDFLRGGKAKAAEQQAKHAETMSKWREAKAVVAQHGAAKTKAATVRGQQVGVKQQTQVGTSLKVPKAMGDSMESVIAKQLQYSGYTDEYIEARTGQLDEIFGFGKKARAAKAADKERRVASLDYAAAQRNKDLGAKDDKELALRRSKQDQDDIDRRLPSLMKKGAQEAEARRKAAAEKRDSDRAHEKHQANTRPWMTTGR